MQPNTSGLPFDDIRALIANLPGPDEAAAAAVRARDRELVKPSGALGRLDEIAEWLAAWQGRARPALTRPLVCLFAAAHGVAARGVTTETPADTRRLMEIASAGGAAINQLCAAHDLGLKVFDLAIDLPTADFSIEPALAERACAATMAFGMEAVAGGVDLICLGALGSGAVTSAAAIHAALFGGAVATWAGEGDDEISARRREVIARALARHAGELADPLEVLRRLGGREIAALAGAILAARLQRAPVILDGVAASAAAAVLDRLAPDALAHCLAGHRSAEPGHGAALERLGLRPLLDLGLRSGDASGAALAAVIVKAAAALHAGMVTAKEAGGAP